MTDTEFDGIASCKSWQAARMAELSGPDSWLGVVGLFWLEPGQNRVGAGEDCAIRLPGGPAYLGDVQLTADGLLWQPRQGASQPLVSDRDGPPSVISFENWSFFAVDRDGRIAIRVRDRAWAQARPFAGLTYFDADPAWMIEATWEVLPAPILMAVPNVSGELKEVAVTHRAVFSVAGEPVALLPMSVSAEAVFFVFRDRTSGRETYGAGRFLKAAPAVDGRIRLDFNRAFNPPCAFTPFATCPLPPPENWLPFAVRAGELKPASK